MKQIFLIYLFLSILFNGFSETVSEDKALRVASNFLFGTEHPVKSVSFYGDTEDSGMYIINFIPEGWAIVSGNNNARPVIGYSHEGYFDVKNVSSNVKSWLEYQKVQLANAMADLKWSDEWNTLEKQALPALKSATAVTPLLETEWDQGAGWNRFCPPYAEGPDGKAYVGCVAVAMAQALHYMKFPERPSGQKSYQLAPYGTISLNFDEEPAYQWDKMSLTASDDYNAKLLYHCAVAVEMDFGGDGSGAYTTRVPFAFQRYFGFTPSVKTISRYENDEEWITLLKSELDNDNVLIYSGNPGTGEAGHAFNIDGYAPTGYFHFNWGWSGKYNGYFSINNVAPGSSDFTKDQKAVVGISHPYWGPTDITLSNLSVKENLPAGTVVGDISITDYSENDHFTFEVFGAPLFLGSGYAPAKFYEENMQLKTLETLLAGPYPEVATIRVTDSEGNVLEKRFEITVTKVTNAISTADQNSFRIYPNPANNIIYVTSGNELNYYRITDITGKTVLHSDRYNNGIDITSLREGIYIFEFSDSKNKKQVQKIIVQK
ncbi:MAG: T9SS type A sorting domain-containing protein [Bacteroidales bacterium]|nr:T9SS type A sorting domain-containing protein [Bacteroidales bacterium]